MILFMNTLNRTADSECRTLSPAFGWLSTNGSQSVLEGAGLALATLQAGKEPRIVRARLSHSLPGASGMDRFAHPLVAFRLTSKVLVSMAIHHWELPLSEKPIVTTSRLESAGRCFDSGHKPNSANLEVFAASVDTVQTLIEIQGKTLQHGSGQVRDNRFVHPQVFGGGNNPMNTFTLENLEQRRAKSSAAALALIPLNILFLLLYALPVPSYARGSQQEQSRVSLGSLTGVGEVYLNDSLATGESTIFSGDNIRTGQTGTATFDMGGKGTLKISPQSQVVFSGNYQFTAELVAGTIVLNTFTGPNGLTLRIGNYVVVSYSRKQPATLKVTRTSNGSVQVSCLDGTAGVLTLEGQVGQLLQAGQAMNVSASSYLSSNTLVGQTSGEPFHKGWLLLGLAGAGAAAASALLIHGGASQSISPSGP